MKYVITRRETIEYDLVIEAESEEDALAQFEEEKGQDPTVLNTETKIEKIKSKREATQYVK